MLDGIGNRPELLNGRSSHLFVGLPVSSDMGAMSERPDRWPRDPNTCQSPGLVLATTVLILCC